MSNDTPQPAVAAGWYPDPRRQFELRYWDGREWTEHTHNYDQPATGSSEGARGSGATPVGEWLSATLAQVTGRAGHIFTLILTLSLVPSTVIAVVIWWGLGDAVLRSSDNPDAPFELENFNNGRLWIAGAVIVVATLISLLFGAAVARQTAGAANGAPVPWSTSVRETLVRAPRIIGVGISWFLTLLLAYSIGLALVIVLGVTVPILLLVAVPALFVGMVLLGLRIVLVPTAAALCPRSVGAWSVGMAIARPHRKVLFWRGLTAVALSSLFQFVFGVMSSSAFGGPAEVTQVNDAGGFVVTELTRDNLIGESFLLLLASSLVFAVIGGFAGAFRSTGLALTYTEFDGPVDEYLTQTDPPPPQ